jgi:hypothetical protein
VTPTDRKPLDQLFDQSVGTVVYWDVETASVCDLKTCGADVYARDPSTCMLLMCFAVGDGEVQVWKPGDPVPAPFADPIKYTFVSDNWTFENQILTYVLIPQHGFIPIPIERQGCAQRKALASAFPASLNRRCEALDLPYRKDRAAADALRRLSRLSKPYKYKDPAKRERDFELVTQRCQTDVKSTRAAYTHTRLHSLSLEERQVLLLDATINARGIRGNMPFIKAGHALMLRVRHDINARIAELTEGAVTSVHQTQKLKEAINARGHNLATLDKRAVAACLAHKPDDVSRELLGLRQRGAHQNVFKRLLAHTNPNDERIRGGLRYHGAGPGRWTSPGAGLHGLSRNDEEFPAALIDALMAGDYAALERYGDLLKVTGQLERAALCAADGHELICADLSMIESRVTAWIASEMWKVAAFQKFDASGGDKGLDPYRVFAHRLLQKNSPISEITAAERQLGKCGELACGFGGGLRAWRRIAKDEDVRSDEEVKAIVYAWRTAHPRITAFWDRLARAARSSIVSGKPVQVSAVPHLVTDFDGYALTITLPSGRVINYPGAHLVPSEMFVNGAHDIEFMDNTHGKWAPVRAWYGTLTENVVQGIARDLLSSAIVRAETRGLRVVHHAHDEIVVEAPIGTVTPQDVLACLLEAPPWAAGLPLGGKVRSGILFFEPGNAAPPTEPIAAAHHVVNTADDTADESEDEAEDAEAVETSVQLSQGIRTLSPQPVRVCQCCHLDPPDGTERQLADEIWVHPRCDDIYLRARFAEEGMPWENRAFAPQPQAPPPQASASQASSSVSSRGNGRGDFDSSVVVKMICCPEPEHDDSTPSCALYSDGHYYCFGCEAYGWIEDLDLEDDELAQLAAHAGAAVADDTYTLKLAFKLWDQGESIIGTLAEHYLVDTRKLNLAALSSINDVLRFHPKCVFGKGVQHPCLLALFCDVENDAFAGIHRIGLTAGAKKIERRTLGRWPNARAIKLWPATNKLSIGEGVETVLAAIRCGAITPPAWAVGGRTNIAEFPVLPDIRALTILVDNDGDKARPNAKACAERYLAAGGKVRLLTTKHVKDFNDLPVQS